MITHWMKQGILHSLCYLYDNPLAGYTQLLVADQKNESVLLEEVRS